jgi:hypothetical protein
MKLSRLLEDNSAAEEAKRLGLERKPGFGLYGPPGKDKPATHRSAGGKLIQFEKPPSVSTPQASAPSEQPASKAAGTVRRRRRKHSPPSVAIMDKKFKPHPSAKVSDVVQKLRATVDNDVIYTPKLWASLLGSYGRHTLPTVVTKSPVVLNARKFMGMYVLGAYTPGDDTVHVDEGISFADTPVQKWTPKEVETFEVFVHEYLHSTSPRFGKDVQGYTSHRQMAVEEGLTEYLAYSITSEFTGKRSNKLQYLYPQEVTAIRFLADVGGLDVDKAFRSERADLEDMIQVAQHTAMWKMLEEAGVSEDDRAYIDELLDDTWERGMFAMASKTILLELERIYYMSDNKKYQAKLIEDLKYHLANIDV